MDDSFIDFYYLFSPPYGDGTRDWVKYNCHFKFSPPYGDGTKNYELQ